MKGMEGIKMPSHFSFGLDESSYCDRDKPSTGHPGQAAGKHTPTVPPMLSFQMRAGTYCDRNKGIRPAIMRRGTCTVPLAGCLP